MMVEKEGCFIAVSDRFYSIDTKGQTNKMQVMI